MQGEIIFMLATLGALGTYAFFALRGDRVSLADDVRPWGEIIELPIGARNTAARGKSGGGGASASDAGRRSHKGDIARHEGGL